MNNKIILYVLQNEKKKIIKSKAPTRQILFMELGDSKFKLENSDQIYHTDNVMAEPNTVNPILYGLIFSLIIALFFLFCFLLDLLLVI